MNNKLFVMSAASGAGKTTLKDLVIKDFPDIKYSISATTRAPREGEVDGVHYFFKTKEEFLHAHSLRLTYALDGHWNRKVLYCHLQDYEALKNRTQLL